MTAYQFDDSLFTSKFVKSDGCWTWTASKNSSGYGTFSVRSSGRIITARAHRVMYEMTTGEDISGVLIDHICHNTSCVNPDHLRKASPKQNSENRAGAQANSKSGIRGVSWQPANRRWRAQVRHNGQCFYLGMFASIDDAATAARTKRNELFTHNIEQVAA